MTTAAAADDCAASAATGTMRRSKVRLPSRVSCHIVQIITLEYTHGLYFATSTLLCLYSLHKVTTGVAGKSARTCKCGSTDHQRVTSKHCPLNKKRQKSSQDETEADMEKDSLRRFWAAAKKMGVRCPECRRNNLKSKVSLLAARCAGQAEARCLNRCANYPHHTNPHSTWTTMKMLSNILPNSK